MWFKYSRAVYNRSHDRAVSKGSPGRKFTSLTSKSPDEELTCYAPRDLVVNASPSPERWLPAIRKIVASADPQQPVSNIRTMNEIVAGQTESRTIQLRVLISLTAVAILLAAVGIYGLLWFAVSLRQQEFGIRTALGARRGDIFRMVLRQGAIMAVADLLPGAALAYFSAKVVQGLLAGIKPDDAWRFSIAAGICLSTTLIGSLVPAIRAFRVDPTTVMCAE